MKKMKGVAAAAAAVTIGSSSPPYAGSGYQDPRIRFKHESLMQDYEELLKETEGKRKRLETMKQRRLTLMAEVRFLRRRFKFLTENQARNPNPEQQLQGAVINKSRKARKNNNNNNSKGTSSGHDEAAPAPKFDLNRKGGRVYRAKDDSVAAASCINLNRQQQHRSSYSGREAAAMRNAGGMIPDVNVTKERMLFGKDVAAAAASGGGGGRNNAPFFDLNQVSTEEEELQTNGEMTTATTITTMRMEDPRIVVNTLRGGINIDEHHNNNSDLKLLACRSVGNVPSRSGKRKISWQDPVALRV